jgi:hypothetical protein
MIMTGKGINNTNKRGKREKERSKEIKSIAIKRHKRESGDDSSTWRKPSICVTEFGLVSTGEKSRLILYDL